MDLWHRFRLLACLAVMLGMLGFGGFAWLRWGVPEEPFGEGRGSEDRANILRRIRWTRGQHPDPFHELARYAKIYVIIRETEEVGRSLLDSDE